MKTQKIQKIEQYRREGVCFIDRINTLEEMKDLETEIANLMEENVPGTIYEEDGKTIRGMHGCHLSSSIFDKLTRHPVLLDFIEDILQTKVYVHQLKINFKNAFNGTKWDWHQDFVFWNREDGIPKPDLINVMIALDDINEFNGPLFLIPNSHKKGAIDEKNGLVILDAEKDSNWKNGFSEKLKYTIDENKVKSLVDENGLLLGKCNYGNIMFFDSNVVHASSPNISPYNRKVLIITYNSVINQSIFRVPSRPEYISARECRALEPDLT